MSKRVGGHPTLCLKTIDDRSAQAVLHGAKATFDCAPEHQVRLAALDQIVSPSEALSFFILKIDVEGFEGQALAGATRLLSSPSERPCYVYIELKKGKSYRDAVLILQHHGYSKFRDLDCVQS